MKYDLKDTIQADLAFGYLQTLVEQESEVEVKKLIRNRSLNQNSYLHLLLGAFGANFGYNLQESKQLYKQINKDIYYYTKENRGKKLDFVRSSADLDKEEMAKTIDKFMQMSEQAGYKLPPAEDQGWIRELENDVEMNRHYL